jgi:hypothetical protein
VCFRESRLLVYNSICGKYERVYNIGNYAQQVLVGLEGVFIAGIPCPPSKPRCTAANQLK